MADTTYIKTTVEPYVREWLRMQYGLVFHERELSLSGGGSHKFDAVAIKDGTPFIAANILSNRPKTASGKENTGGVRKALVDATNFARLPDGVEPKLVFTDTGFLELILRRSKAKGINGIEFLHCPLPLELAGKLQKVLDVARKEQRSATGR